MEVDASTHERMGEKYIPKIIIWYEVFHGVRVHIKMDFDWLVTQTRDVIMCGDHGQPPRFVGSSPHDWLKEFVDYYEEIFDDHRAIDEPLKKFKKDNQTAARYD